MILILRYGVQHSIDKQINSLIVDNYSPEQYLKKEICREFLTQHSTNVKEITVFTIDLKAARAIYLSP